jgi:hypothetical protein
MFMGFSFLARQSVLPIILPIYLYFGLLYFSSEEEKEQKINFKNFLILNTGFFSVITLFLLYIIRESALTEWVHQSFTIAKFYVHKNLWLNFLLCLLKGGSTRGRDARTILYSLIFFNALIVGGIVFIKATKNQLTDKIKLLFLLSAVTFFGYLNSLHIYDVFRLQSASSLGFGLLIFSLNYFSQKFKKWKIFIFNIPIISLFIYLISTLLFTATPAINIPWNQSLLFSNQLKAPEDVPILKDKLSNREEREYYQTLTHTLYHYSCQLDYLINFSRNSYFLHLSSRFKLIQRSPFYDPGLSALIFQDEQKRIAELIAEQKAIIMMPDKKLLPEDYMLLLEIAVPDSVSIKLGEKTTYVAIPKKTYPSCSSKPM